MHIAWPTSTSKSTIPRIDVTWNRASWKATDVHAIWACGRWKTRHSSGILRYFALTCEVADYNKRYDVTLASFLFSFPGLAGIWLLPGAMLGAENEGMVRFKDALIAAMMPYRPTGICWQRPVGHFMLLCWTLLLFVVRGVWMSCILWKQPLACSSGPQPRTLLENYCHH